MRLLAALLAFLLLFGAVCAEIAVEPEADEVYAGRDDVIGVQLLVRNLGSGEECVEIEAEPDTGYIEAFLSVEEACLAEGQATSTTLTIRTENAPRGEHEVEVRAESEEGEAFAVVSVFVSEEPGIELVAYGNDICLGKREKLNVIVRNNGSFGEEVELQAENEMLLPYFRPDKLTLDSGEERNVKLYLYTGPYFSLGEEEVSLFAITEREIVKETILLEVADCREQGERLNFMVETPRECVDVEKGVDEKIYFSVENLADEEQRLNFSVSGDVPADMKTGSAMLEAGEEREFYFRADVPESARAEDLNVVLRVWNDFYTTEKRICLLPEESHASSLEVEENDLELRACESLVFTVTVNNEGDFNQDYRLFLENAEAEIDASLSDDAFELAKHSSRDVFVNVSASPAAEEGNYSILLVVETDEEDLEKELRFEVLPAREPGRLEIASYPSSIRMDENSAAEVLVVLRNPTLQPISGAVLQVAGLPQGISATSKSGISLDAGAERQFSLEIVAEKGATGEYSLRLLATGASERAVQLFVGEEEGDAGAVGSLTGMFALGSGALLGLAFLAILAVAILLISRALRAPNTKNKNETWMRG